MKKKFFASCLLLCCLSIMLVVGCSKKETGLPCNEIKTIRYVKDNKQTDLWSYYGFGIEKVEVYDTGNRLLETTTNTHDMFFASWQSDWKDSMVECADSDEFILETQIAKELQLSLSDTVYDTPFAKVQYYLFSEKYNTVVKLKMYHTEILCSFPIEIDTEHVNEEGANEVKYYFDSSAENGELRNDLIIEQKSIYLKPDEIEYILYNNK